MKKILVNMIIVQVIGWGLYLLLEAFVHEANREIYNLLLGIVVYVYPIATLIVYFLNRKKVMVETHIYKWMTVVSIIVVVWALVGVACCSISISFMESARWIGYRYVALEGLIWYIIFAAHVVTPIVIICGAEVVLKIIDKRKLDKKAQEIKSETIAEKINED